MFKRKKQKQRTTETIQPATSQFSYPISIVGIDVARLAKENYVRMVMEEITSLMLESVADESITSEKQLIEHIHNTLSRYRIEE